MSDDHIRNLDELERTLREDLRFHSFEVVRRGDGFVEVRLGDGGVIFVSPGLLFDEEGLETHFTRSSQGSTLLCVVGADEDMFGIEELRDLGHIAVMTTPLPSSRLYVTLRNYLDLVSLRARAVDRSHWAERYRYELGELIAISRAISSERDVSKLLGLILEKCRYVTGADAGSVYIVEGQALNPRERTLRFMVSQNDSIDIDFREFTLSVDEQSIVGRAVTSRELINIPDLYRLECEGCNPWGLHHDKSFDRKVGYQGRSMLTVPMVNQRDEVIGVIQLINKRRDGAPALTQPEHFTDWVVPFDKRSEELAATLASQAGISLENSLLYDEIQRMFEGFVNAAVTAIESRDPTTSGHSYRVATLTVGLAEMVDRESSGPFAGVHFQPDELKEIEYAGLLHDFGKVGVREQVLIKAKKLYEHERDLLLTRFDYIRKAIETDCYKRKLELVLRDGASAADRHFADLDEEQRRKLAELDAYVAFVIKANEPTVLPEGSFEKLAEIANLTFLDPRGDTRPYLTPGEVAALRLPKGSLTTEERLEIESHVVHTFNFLENIPWGRRLGKVPLIAGSHHEKLDGTGYPRGLPAEQIRLETRMMTIADIFDALTASDRPYKKAVPVDKALDIIGFEVKQGKCDPELFRLFVDAKVWQLVIAG